jgi:hypothetical protein
MTLYPRTKLVFLAFIFLWMFCSAKIGAAADRDVGEKFDIALEAGPVWQSYNDVRIPGDSGTLFSFKDLTGSGPYAAGRLAIGWNLEERHSLRFTVAPLRVTGSGTPGKTVSFADRSFAAGESIDASYKFDTYRLTYRYLFLNTSHWRLHAGGTVLLRDAEIRLKQNDVNASESNVGVVPLLSLAAEWLFVERWSAIFDFDGLAGGPGRAFDAAVKLQYELTDRWRIGAGYRTLEGGADNDTAYNFAWFHYAFISVDYRF